MATLAYGRLSEAFSLSNAKGSTPTVAAPYEPGDVTLGLVVAGNGRHGVDGVQGTRGADATTWNPPYGVAGGIGGDGARGQNGQDVSLVVSTLDPTITELSVRATGGNGGGGGGGGGAGLLSTYRTEVRGKYDDFNKVIWDETTDRSGNGSKGGDGGAGGRGGHAKTQIINLDVKFQNGQTQVELLAHSTGGAGGYGGWGANGSYGAHVSHHGFTYGNRFYTTFSNGGSLGGNGGDGGNGGLGGYATSRIANNDIDFAGAPRIGMNAWAWASGGGSGGTAGSGATGGTAGGTAGDGGHAGASGIAIAEIVNNTLFLSGNDYGNVFISAQATSNQWGNYGGTGGVGGHQVSFALNTSNEVRGVKAEDGDAGAGGAGGQAASRVNNNVITSSNHDRNDFVTIWAEAWGGQGGPGGNRYSDSQGGWVQGAADGALGTSTVEVINNRIMLGGGDDTITLRVNLAANSTQTLTLSRNLFDGGDGHDTFSFQAELGRVIDFGIGQTVGGVTYAGVTLFNFEQVNLSDADETIRLDAADTQVWAGKGTDAIYGGGGNDGLMGAEGDDKLYGEADNDWLTGGLGADRLDGGDGWDTANYRQATSAVRVDVEGTAGVGEALGDIFVSIEAFSLTDLADRFIGGSAGEHVRGHAGSDVLYGQGGEDHLWGGGGDDILDGGAGYDAARYDDAGAAVAVNLLTGSATGGAGSDGLRNIENAWGSDYGDTFIGNATSNWFWGRGGDDLYVIGANDRVFEAAGEGYDTVRTTHTFKAAGQHIERIEIIGDLAASAFGNELDNVLIGNAQANSFDGGLGADRMEGGAGNDLYVVDNLGDVVVELWNGGTDTVRSTLNHTLGDNIENLVLLGSAAVNAIGNALNNTITGNARANVLIGMGGRDLMTGGGGADRFDFRALSDSPFAAYDRITDLTDADVINLSLIDANTTLAGNQAFVLADALTGVAGQLVRTYVAAGNYTFLTGDVNGDGVGDFRVILNGDHAGYDNFIL